jgi:hypothetical protein
MKTIHEHVKEHFDKIKDGRVSLEQLAVMVGCTKGTAMQAYSTMLTIKAREKWRANNEPAPLETIFPMSAKWSSISLPPPPVKLPPVILAPEMDVDVNELIAQAQGVELFDGVRSSVIAVRTLTPRIEPLPDGRERVIYQSQMNY